VALVLDVADALVEALNGGAFSLPFQAVRAYVPAYRLQEMTALRVTVIPREVTSEPYSRGQRLYTVRIDVGVQKRVDPEDTAAVDALVDLVHEMEAFLRGRDLELPGGETAKWRETEWPALWLPDHLREYRQFTSVLSPAYEVAA